MPENNNNIMSIEGQLVGIPLAGPESFSQQQLDYLKRALGVDETVLWSGNYESTGSITLSESFKNFELIRVEFITNDNISFTSIFNSAEQNTNMVLLSCYVRSAVTGLSIKASQYTLTNTTITLSRGYDVSVGQSATQTSGNKLTIKRVVGIHRIAGGN